MAPIQQMRCSILFLLVVACILIPSMQAQPVKGDPGDSSATNPVCCGRDHQCFRALKVGPGTPAVTPSWGSDKDGSECDSAKASNLAIGKVGEVNNDDYVNILRAVSVGQYRGETGSPGWIPGDANEDVVANTLEALPVFTMSNESITIHYEYDEFGKLTGAYAHGTIEVSDGLGSTCTGNVTITYTILAGKAKPLRKTITVPYDYGDTSRFASWPEPVPVISPVEFVTDYEHNSSGVLLGGTTSVILENVGAAGDVMAECRVSVDTCRVIFCMDQGARAKLTAYLSSTALGGYSVKYIYWEWRPALVGDIAEGQMDVERMPIALGITTTALPKAKVGDYYETTLEATGGATPYAWTATGLPDGLTCSTAGLILGTPTEAGTFNFTVEVTDAVEDTATRDLSIMVDIWTPWSYDENSDGVIQKMEALQAVQDYFAEKIAKAQVLEVIQLYFAG